MSTRFFLPASLLTGLPYQFLGAWFLDERIIVEAPGYPSAEDERCRRHWRLIPRLGHYGRAFLAPWMKRLLPPFFP